MSKLFNINNQVSIKLTDVGRELLIKQHDELFSHRSPRQYMPPKEVDGWSKWQLWEVMEAFGPFVSMGFVLPFEPTIRIEGPFEDA